jgi:hypothetical protein
MNMLSLAIVPTFVWLTVFSYLIWLDLKISRIVSDKEDEEL